MFLDWSDLHEVREYKYSENSPKSVPTRTGPGNNSYQPSGTDSSPQWASSQGAFLQQAFGTRDPPFSLAIFGMLETFDTWRMPLKPGKHPKKPNILQTHHVIGPQVGLPTSQWLFCLESMYLRRPRSLNFRDQFPELPSQSHPTTCTKHRLWYRPQELRGLQESSFLWFPWANQPPFDTPCQHPDAFRSMFHCHDCSWKKLSVLHPILIEVATFFFFRLGFCQGLHVATANKSQWSKIKILFSLDSNHILLSVPLHPHQVHHLCVSGSIAAHCGMQTTSFHSQSPPLEAPQLR